MTSAPYPFASHYFERNGHRLHYVDEGAGEPVVMVHGNPTWSYYYRNLIAELRGSHRCIAPDHIGCGLSDKPQPPAYDYSLKCRVDDFSALMEHLGVRENVTLVVHDWGGMIGMAWAARNINAIKRLVILNTAAFPMPTAKKFPLRLWIGRNTKLGSWLIRSRNAFCLHAAGVGVKRKPLPVDVREWYLKPYDSWDNRVAVLKFVQTIPLKANDPGYDIVESTANKLHAFANTPTLICWGMRDFVFSHEFLMEWEKRMPHAKVHRFEDCGHYILEDAASEVIPLVKEFASGN